MDTLFQSALTLTPDLQGLLTGSPDGAVLVPGRTRVRGHGPGGGTKSIDPVQTAHLAQSAALGAGTLHVRFGGQVSADLRLGPLARLTHPDGGDCISRELRAPSRAPSLPKCTRGRLFPRRLSCPRIGGRDGPRESHALWQLPLDDRTVPSRGSSRRDICGMRGQPYPDDDRFCSRAGERRSPL